MVSNLSGPSLNTALPIPNPYLIGLGCQKQTAVRDILSALSALVPPGTGYIHTLALPAFKQSDPPILALQKKVSFSVQFISKESLVAQQANCHSFSQMSYQRTGLGSIAEACVRAIMQQKDHLLIPKTIYNGITVSLARKG